MTSSDICGLFIFGLKHVRIIERIIFGRSTKAEVLFVSQYDVEINCWWQRVNLFLLYSILRRGRGKFKPTYTYLRTNRKTTNYCVLINKLLKEHLITNGPSKNISI